MKISGYHKELGDIVELIIDYSEIVRGGILKSTFLKSLPIRLLMKLFYIFQM